MKDNDTLDTTVDEWQAEMERYDKKNIAGKTLMELSQKLHISRTTMGFRLQTLIDEGRCTRDMGVRIDKSGRRFEVAVYQLTSQEKASEK